MGVADISAPLARILARILSVPNVGLVHDRDVFDRDDVVGALVSQIAGEATLRAWMITGPQLVTADRMTQSSSGVIEREWEYTLIGVEGLREDGSSLVTMRANALAVMDAIDSDWSLGGTCHRTRPCRIVDGPENRALTVSDDGIGVSYVEVVKPVVTISTP